ncbi:DUF4829 domain-containing protein [Clostridium sp.]|uniref:DUF4829 domain-containing protein n=1 Tax=Clostridium sp. TaxID=1506 RepID=UPI0032177E96
MQKAIRISIILFFSIFFIAFCFANCKPGGKIDNVVVNIGESSKFTEEEINKAVDCVKKSFESGYTGCTLIKTWYDEEKSNSAIEGYLQNGRGSINGVNPENVIVLFSNFDVDSSGGDGSLNPNSTYTDYNWVLIRGSQRGKWRIDDRGFGL